MRSYKARTRGVCDVCGCDVNVGDIVVRGFTKTHLRCEGEESVKLELVFDDRAERVQRWYGLMFGAK